MRVILILLLALAVAASAAYVEKGCLKFQLINSTAGLEGRFLLYIYQPLCEECKKIEQQVFGDCEVAYLLSGYRLYVLDLSRSPLAGIDVYLEGQLVYVDHGVARYYAARGNRTFLIPGTPTVILGVAEGGRIKLLGFWTGTDMPQGVGLKQAFIQFLKEAEGSSTTAEESRIEAWPLLWAFALGVASAFSPCVLPVLSIAAVTHFARRSVGKVLAGMVASYALLGVLVAALGGFAASARAAVTAVGGALLIALGLVLLVERLNLRYAAAVSRLQTSAFKRFRAAGDFLLGFSLGAVWVPCILPYAGLATVIALSSLAGDYALLFAALLFYGGGLAAAVYAVVKGALKYIKPGKWVERGVGLLLITIGAYLLLSL
jgi:cytochrome c biogenesis protein CcdA/thioredoxin-related protein